MTKEQVLELVLWKSKFGIYKTQKGTQVLVINPSEKLPHLYTIDKSRDEWKSVEDKKIARCVELLFDQDSNPETLDTSGWNGGKQIITYQFPQYILDKYKF